MVSVPKYMLNAIIEEISLKQWAVLLVVITVGSVLIYTISNIFSHIFKTHISIARNGCYLCFRANMLFWSDNSGMAGVFDSLKKILANGITLTEEKYGKNTKSIFILLYCGCYTYYVT